MTNTEFNKLIKGTKLGQSGKGTASLDAARLFFVDSFGTVAACAREIGCSEQTVRVTINRIRELIDQQDMEAVTVLVPKGKKTALKRYAQKLQAKSFPDDKELKRLVEQLNCGEDVEIKLSYLDPLLEKLKVKENPQRLQLLLPPGNGVAWIQRLPRY